MANSKNILRKDILRQDIVQAKAAKNISAKIIEHFFVPSAILLLAVAVAAFYLIFGKTYQAFRSGQGSVNVAIAELGLTDARSRLAIRKQHAAELETIPAANRERMARVLPTGPNELETLVQIESFVKEDLNLESMTFTLSVGGQAAGKTEAKGEAAAAGAAEANAARLAMETVSDKVNMSFKVIDYESLKKAVLAIEKNLRLLDINSITYNPESGDVSLNITTRHLP
ncbi:hypothetical protein A3I40_03820 [Candidatus Uhrbacteria bacterium RIFCSPLOWO2_02_FULL_48_12]|uniref:Uncharacterized protein n=1 Tax=Candidatus Uhrbacteria bacterium RIFCSPLOWO2_02_FULL_48_12 TaxID=1802407 RepID=A0A1F7V9Y0_9BACT|nr:MAG: hypothetical protein A3I40_03820 [Candidatus Uhrbacteria bacterium RIFCSPLOWO2_02_FULL_48_12]